VSPPSPPPGPVVFPVCLPSTAVLGGSADRLGRSASPRRLPDVDAFDIEVNTRDPEKTHRDDRPALAHVCGHQSRGHQGAGMLRGGAAAQADAVDLRFHDDQHGTAIISGAALLNAVNQCKTPAGTLPP